MKKVLLPVILIIIVMTGCGMGPVAVTGIDLIEKAVVLNDGGSCLLAASVIPANAANAGVAWSSDDESVATVDQTGLVTAAGNGRAHVTVTAADGGFTDSAEIIVCEGTVFVTLWDMSLGEGTTLTLPMTVSGTYDYTIDWGDGTVQDKTSANAQHVYAAAGSYVVSIAGVCEGFGFGSSVHENKVNFIDVLQWGAVRLHNNGQHFAYCENLTGFSAKDVPDLTGVTCVLNMFVGAHSFDGDISLWDVSGVEIMAGMFIGAYDFNRDISGWNVSNVTDMSCMFFRAYAFNQNIGDWDTSHVTDMHKMFSYADGFDQDLSLWNVAAVTNMTDMFRFAASFTNGGNPAGLDNWTVQGGCDTTDMFQSCPLTPRPSWY